jgi:hypothetical protein
VEDGLLERVPRRQHHPAHDRRHLLPRARLGEDVPVVRDRRALDVRAADEHEVDGVRAEAVAQVVEDAAHDDRLAVPAWLVLGGRDEHDPLDGGHVSPP